MDFVTFGAGSSVGRVNRRETGRQQDDLHMQMGRQA